MAPPYTLVVLDGDLIQFSQGALDHGGAPTAARLRGLAAKAVLSERDKQLVEEKQERFGKAKAGEDVSEETANGRICAEGLDCGMQCGLIKPDERIEQMLVRCVILADTELLGAAFAENGALPGGTGRCRERSWVEWVKAFNDVTCFTDIANQPNAEMRAQEVLRMALHDPACTAMVYGGRHKEQHLNWARETRHMKRVFITFTADCSEKVLLDEPRVLQKNPFPGVFRRKTFDLEEINKTRREAQDNKDTEEPESDARSDGVAGEQDRASKMPSASPPSLRKSYAGLDTGERTYCLPTGSRSQEFHLDLPPEAAAQLTKDIPNFKTTTVARQPHDLPSLPPMPKVGTRGPKSMKFDRHGNRIDERCYTNGTMISRITAIHPCNNHYLRGKCMYVGCRHEHNLQFNEEEMEALRYIGRRIKCRNGRGCRDEECHAGHICPNLSCDAISCGFPRDWHVETSLLAHGKGWMLNGREQYRVRGKSEQRARSASPKQQQGIHHTPQSTPLRSTPIVGDPRLHNRNMSVQQQTNWNGFSSSRHTNISLNHSITAQRGAQKEGASSQEMCEGSSESNGLQRAKPRRLPPYISNMGP